MTQRSPFRYFKTSPEIICLAVMLYFSSWQVGFQSRLYQSGFKLETFPTISMGYQVEKVGSQTHPLRHLHIANPRLGP